MNRLCGLGSMIFVLLALPFIVPIYAAKVIYARWQNRRAG